MKTSKFSRYFLVLLCALGCNAASAQDEVSAVNVFFNERQSSGVPTISLGSNAPKGVSVSQTGFTWATNYKWSSLIYPSCSDRVVVKKTNSSPKTATISFSGFKYEVTRVKWNVICDYLANTPKVNTSVISENGKTITGKFDDNSSSFSVSNYPGTPDKLDGFYGLKSLVINDEIRDDYSRVFLKAGTEEQQKNRQSGNNYFAFQIYYYKPSVEFKKEMPDRIELNKTLDVSKLYTIKHPGAFNFTTSYRSSDSNIFTVNANGVITPKNLGTAVLTVAINDGAVTKRVEKNIEIVLADNQYLVNLKYCDETDNGETIIATYGQPLPNGLTAPTREGYEFKGYYNNQNQDYAEGKGQNYGGKQYYNKDMIGVANWDYKYNGATIYGHWAPKIYIVTLDAAGGILPNPVVKENAKNFNITKKSNSVMTLSIAYKTGDDKTLVHSTAKKPGYELLGWFDSNGKKIISVDEKSRNCTITDNGGYWTENGMKYNHIGNITLTAHYRQKYKYSKNVISFDNEKVEAGEDWLWSVVNDLVGAAKDVYEKVEGHPQTMVFDLRKSTNMWTSNKYERLKVMQSLQKDEYKDYISPNVLVYFNDKEGEAWYDGNVNDCYNAVSLDNKCKRLVVTDRYEIEIPYAFKANNALYERNKNYSSDDAVVAQAANSKWGTLCLPYPIKNNSNNVKFYKLAGLKNNYMHFNPMEDAVIPANTPVLYKRMEGAGSDVKIEEAGVDVPMNTSYSTNPGSSYDSWQFIGTLTTKIFCGKDYDDKKVPAGAEKMNGSKEIYYFKQDQFTHLKNTGKVTMLPYRAYFTTTEANAKVAAFSLVAIDEEGATDITNLIDNDAEGDGKIYDLNGRRVMQPVSGRLYIVDGKKKVY